jgi:hypothetical protein
MRLANQMDPNELDRISCVLNKVNEGGWITAQSVEQIEVNEQNGYCNFVYMNVSFFLFFKILKKKCKKRFDKIWIIFLTKKTFEKFQKIHITLFNF